MIVIERGGEIVAWAGAGSYRSRPCYDPIADHSVYVDRDQRGGGVGRVALEALCAEAERLGFLKLVSRIFPRTWPVWRSIARLAFAKWASTAAMGSWMASGATASIVEKLLGAKPREARSVTFQPRACRTARLLDVPAQNV